MPTPRRHLARPAQVAVALLAAASISCQATPAEPTVAAPASFTIGPGANFDEIIVTWMAPDVMVDLYQVQLRFGNGAYQFVPGSVPGDSIGAVIVFAPTSPDLTTIRAQVRASKGGVWSEPSAEASWQRGLREPSRLSATDIGEQIRLSWTQGSTGATEVRIERAHFVDANSSFEPWVAIATVPGGWTSYSDASVVVGDAYAYRIKNRAMYEGSLVETMAIGGAWARTTVMYPIGLAATVVAGHTHLDWFNRTSAATSIRIERAAGLMDQGGSFQTAAILPPDAVGWDDVTDAGPFTYRVVALAGASQGASEPRNVVVAPAGFVAWALMLEPAEELLRVGDGFWLGALSPNGAYLTTRGLPVASSRGLDTRLRHFAHAGIVLDPAGHVHAAYAAGDGTVATSSPSNIVHEWSDGTAWHREVVATRVLSVDAGSRPRLWLALASDGTPHLAWQSEGNVSPEHAVKGAAGWVTEPVGSALYDPASEFEITGFAVAPDDTLFLLTQASGAVLLATHPAGGGWTDELVPTGADLDDTSTLLPFAGGVAVAFGRYVSADADPVKVDVVTRTGVAWDAVSEVVALGGSGVSGATWAVGSTGNRMAVVVPESQPEGLMLHSWDEGSGWKATRLGQSEGWGFVRLGTTPAGKFWILGRSTAAAPLGSEWLARPFALFEEL